MTTYLIWIGVYLLVGFIIIITSYKKEGGIYVRDIFDIICLLFLWPISLAFSLERGFEILCEKISEFWDKIKDKKIG